MRGPIENYRWLKTLKAMLKALGFTIYNSDLSVITRGGSGGHYICKSLIRDPV